MGYYRRGLGLTPKYGPETCHHKFDTPRKQCATYVKILKNQGWVGLDCRFMANCPLVGPGPIVGVP